MDGDQTEAERLLDVLTSIIDMGTANPGYGHTCARIARDAVIEVTAGMGEQPWLVKRTRERRDLEVRIYRLQTFLGRDPLLSPRELELMKQQLFFMQGYVSMLNERIAAATAPEGVV